MGWTGRRSHEPITDARPEFYPYRDEGCEVSPSCLRCPLPMCKYDNPGMLSRMRRDARNRAIREEHQRTYVSMLTLAAKFGVSPRSISRIVNGNNVREDAAADGRRVGGQKGSPSTS